MDFLKWENGIFSSHTEVEEKAIHNGGKEHVRLSLFPKGKRIIFWGLAAAASISHVLDHFPDLLQSGIRLFPMTIQQRVIGT